MGLLTWILVGLVAGLLAEFILGGGTGIGLRGLVLTTLLGIVGAVVGGFVSVELGYGEVTGFNVRSLVIAVLGAIAVIIVFRALSSRGGGRRRRLI
ncbi:MAG: GlsB/YeaQ/YmgE family stress response membrane protein [Tepidiformaceae bacterium]